MIGPRWDKPTSRRWLQGQRANPDKGYLNLCAHLFSRAKGFDGAGVESASVWASIIPAQYRRHSGRPKPGDVWFWRTNGWGHVAESVGHDGDGTEYVLCNVGDVVRRVRLSYFASLGTPFWVDGDAPIYGRCFGVNPGPRPKLKPVAPTPAAPAAPAPAGLDWPIAPGMKRVRVATMKAALGWDNTSAAYGDAFAERVAKFQRHHPECGRVDGVINRRTFTAVTGRTAR